MSDEQYFKPNLADFYDGCIFYLKVPDIDKISVNKKWVYATQRFHATRLAFNLVVKQHGNSYELNDDVYMKYLDGEQIEAFGFDRINMPPWGYNMAIGAPDIEWFSSKNGEWFLCFTTKYRNLGILQYDPKTYCQSLTFSGEVRDINRFKLVIEWCIVAEERRKMEEQQNQIQYAKDTQRPDSLQIGFKGEGS